VQTIELREYQSASVRLTRSEVRQLLGTGLVELKPIAGEEEYELRAGSVVGTIVLPTLRLLIRPKVGLRNLFFLLGYGVELTSWAEERFPYEEDPDLLKAVAYIFEAEVSRAARQGLIRGYQARQETLTTLRGRIDIANQIRTRQGRSFPLECAFEEYTEDIELNRVVKAAIRRLLQVPGLGSDVVRVLRFRHRIFDEVAPATYGPGAVPEVGFNRLNEHWRPAAELARLVLNEGSLRDQVGSTLGISFTVDMNKLFERFVEKVVREEARRAGYQLASQQHRLLAEGITIIPDLILRKSGRYLAVGDAKYKEIESDKLPEADLYQMLAYCVSLGLPSGLLIYAGNRFSRSLAINRANIRLETAGIDLAAQPSAVLERTRTLARRLLKEAEATLNLRKAAG